MSALLSILYRPANDAREPGHYHSLVEQDRIGNLRQCRVAKYQALSKCPVPRNRDHNLLGRQAVFTPEIRNPSCFSQTPLVFVD